MNRDPDFLLSSTIRSARDSASLELHLNRPSFAQLRTIPDEVFELENLKVLSVCGWDDQQTGITEIAQGIARLRNLEMLILSNNQIETLPDELFELVSLKRLYLDGNRIATLSSGIAKLKNLVTLDLAKNRLTVLPPRLGEMQSLENLILHDNLLRELPFEIGLLGNLKWLSLRGNDFANIPLEILTQSTHGIRNYCKQVLREQTVRLNEAKLLIVGEGGVGKTCLTKRIVHDSYQSSEPTTEGIDISKWRILTELTKNFRVNIWDFGGQEIYHSTHQFFLTRRSLYLFVWTARSDEINFDYWLNIVSLLSDSSPIIVVQNKADERTKMLDEHFIQENFPNVIAFHQVSAMNGTGMKELRTRIATEIASLDHVGNVLPKVWVEIRDHLENLAQNCIEYREYKEICALYYLDDDKAKFLSQYYHDVGVFLHFQDNPILKDILFLKPEWATNAVYRIIDEEVVIKSFGRFDFDQLKTIWSEYPEENHLHLVELMKKFELCFEVPNTQEYIIPELLKPSSPSFYWSYDKNLRFEYHYEFMPSGILTRLIVISHHLIHEGVYWKNGVVFERENTKALVTSDPFNRKLQLWIDGIHRKELLSILREKIDYIHTTLNHPATKQMVRCICTECINHDTPFFYSYATVKNFVGKDKKTIQCSVSAENVSIELLLGGIEGRTTIEEEILDILRGMKGRYEDEEGLIREASRIIEIHPNFMGIGLNINELLKKLVPKVRAKTKEES